MFSLPPVSAAAFWGMFSLSCSGIINVYKSALLSGLLISPSLADALVVTAWQLQTLLCPNVLSPEQLSGNRQLSYDAALLVLQCCVSLMCTMNSRNQMHRRTRSSSLALMKHNEIWSLWIWAFIAAQPLAKCWARSLRQPSEQTRRDERSVASLGQTRGGFKRLERVSKTPPTAVCFIIKKQSVPNP